MISVDDNIKVITDAGKMDRAKWESFVLSHPNGNFFQSPSAFEFFQSVENYEPVLAIAEEQNEIEGTLSAVIINEPGVKGNFSKRCIVWGGPICNDSEFANSLIRELTNYTKQKAIYTEFRNLFDVSDMSRYFIESGYEFEERFNYIVKIDSLEANRMKLNENRRRQINKGLKSGARIIQPESIDQVRQFYYILTNLYKRKVKKPLPSFSFFQKFFERKECGKYFLIEFENKIIGGIMCPVYKETIYEWYVCGLDSIYREQSPGVLASWAPIEFAANSGLKYFDFMGAGKPGDQYGVREFKSKFGGELVKYGRYTKINNPFMYKIGKVGLKLMSIWKR